MRSSDYKYDGSKKSKYKYVTAWKNIKTGETMWQATKRQTKLNPQNCKYFESEREAALWVDKQLIEMGFEPVNILKKK